MITRMSKSVTSFFITQGVIQDEDREVYVKKTIIVFIGKEIFPNDYKEAYKCRE